MELLKRTYNYPAGTTGTVAQNPLGYEYLTHIKIDQCNDTEHTEYCFAIAWLDIERYLKVIPDRKPYNRFGFMDEDERENK